MHVPILKYHMRNKNTIIKWIAAKKWKNIEMSKDMYIYIIMLRCENKYLHLQL